MTPIQIAQFNYRQFFFFSITRSIDRTPLSFLFFFLRRSLFRRELSFQLIFSFSSLSKKFSFFFSPQGLSSPLFFFSLERKNKKKRRKTPSPSVSFGSFRRTFPTWRCISARLFARVRFSLFIATRIRRKRRVKRR